MQQLKWVTKTERTSTLAVLTSSASCLISSNWLSSQSRSVSRKDGDIRERVERRSFSWTCSARSSSGLTFLSKLGMRLFNMIRLMLHFPGLGSDFSCRFVLWKWRKALLKNFYRLRLMISTNLLLSWRVPHRLLKSFVDILYSRMSTCGLHQLLLMSSRELSSNSMHLSWSIFRRLRAILIRIRT